MFFLKRLERKARPERERPEKKNPHKMQGFLLY
jgi:hypothetical protein